MVLVCSLLITLFVSSGYTYGQTVDDSLFNFEADLHDFWVDEGGVLERDNTRSFLGEYSLKLAMEGDVFYTIGRDNLGSMVEPGMTITYRFYLPEDLDPDEVVVISPFCMDSNWGDWQSNWVEQHPRGEWFELKLKVPEDYNTPLSRMGVQLWCENAIEIWIDSITVGFDDDSEDPGDPGEPGDPLEDNSLLNFENGETHGFRVDNGATISNDTSISYLGQSSLKVTCPGEGMFTISLDPDGLFKPGDVINFWVYVPNGTSISLQPYVNGGGGWKGLWIDNGELERDSWHHISYPISEGYNLPISEFGVQIFTSGSIHIWLDSINTKDTLALEEKIREANELYDNAVEGTEPGQYPPGSKATLMAAIMQATSVLMDNTSTQADINQATVDLSIAIDAFLASKISQSVNIVVEYDNVINNIRYPFWGINYVAFWDDIQGSPESMHAIAQTGIDYIRFPGGEPGNWYDWAQETEWTTTDTLALRDYANGAGAAIMLQTNPTTNPVNDNGDRNNPSGEHVADWVRYCLDNDVNVPFWEIGNELDIELWDPARLEEFAWYLDIYEEHYDAIKSVDPNAIVMGPCSTNTWYWWGVGILEYFMKAFGNVEGNGKVDAVSLHYYLEGEPTWDFIKSSAQDDWYRAMDFIQGVLDKYDTRDLPLFITETSVAIGTFQGSGTNANMIGALGLADLLGAYRNSGVQSVAIFGCIHNAATNWGLLYGVGEDRPPETPTPTYFILPIWTTSGNKVLNVTGIDRDVERLTLSSYASKKDDGSVQVVIINKEAAPMDVSISIDGIDIDRVPVDIYEMKPKNGSIVDKDVYYNGVLMPDVAREKLPDPFEDEVKGEIYTRQVPGYSLTLLDFKVTSDPDVPAVVNKDVLGAAISSAQAIDLSSYTSESVKAFETALTAALQVFENKDATQDEVDEALAALEEAIKNLITADEEKPSNSDQDENKDQDKQDKQDEEPTDSDKHKEDKSADEDKSEDEALTDPDKGKDEAPSSLDDDNKKSQDAESPKTGDTGYRLWFWMAIAIISGLAGIAAYFTIRSQRCKFI